MQTASHLSHVYYILIVIILFSFHPASSSSPDIQSPRLLDLLIRDYTFNFTSTTNTRTGTPFTVPLPTNLSGASLIALRLRCGSLSRYGTQIAEFHLPPGISVNPCVERVLLVRQTLGGPTWFHLYQNTYNLSRYRFITPVVGIQAYNAGDDLNQNGNPFELGIFSAGKTPITIDFKNLVNKSNTFSVQPYYCATFRSAEVKFKVVTMTQMVKPFVCSAEQQGHFALVTIDNDKHPPLLPPSVPPKTPPKSSAAPGPPKTPLTSSTAPPPEEEMVRDGSGRASKWKLAVGSSIGAALGAFLLGLLLVAMIARAKQRTKMEDMARRAYQEEALQVSMVGHVRAPLAPATRTAPPETDHRYRPPYL